MIIIKYVKRITYDKDKNIISDLWKRFVSGEELDTRVNFGFKKFRHDKF